MSAKKNEVIFLHNSVISHVEGDKRDKREEFLIHGAKGFSAKYYNKDSKQEIRVQISKKDDKYVLKTKTDGKTDEKSLTKAELIKEIGKVKELKFILDYISKAKDLNRMEGTRSGSKKGTKSGSKKGTKSGSKKGSKSGKVTKVTKSTKSTKAKKNTK
jgi:hypothetical protein